MRNKFFLCALGGTPKHAHLFLKVSDNKVGFLEIAINGASAAQLLGFDTYSEHQQFYTSVKIFFE